MATFFNTPTSDSFRLTAKRADESDTVRLESGGAGSLSSGAASGHATGESALTLAASDQIGGGGGGLLDGFSFWLDGDGPSFGGEAGGGAAAMDVDGGRAVVMCSGGAGGPGSGPGGGCEGASCARMGGGSLAGRSDA